MYNPNTFILNHHASVESQQHNNYNLTQQIMSFFPENYEAPKSKLSSYTKIEDGETRLRIMSNMVFGYEVWSGNKPHRYKYSSQIDVTPDKNDNGIDKLNQFIAFIIWNYNTERIECCSITPKSIRSEIDKFGKDPDWGEPLNYDIKITKTGSGKETRYAVTAVPHKPVSPEIQKAFEAKPANLENLFAGLDVFDVKEEPKKLDPEEKEAERVAKIAEEAKATFG